LTQAVHELKGDGKRETTPAAATSTVTIDLPLPAYIPNNYIPEMALRLQVYRRVAGLTALEDVDLMREELRDRFGALPGAVENLLYQIDVKLLAQAAGATAVIAPDDQVQVRLPYLAEINRDKLERDLGLTVTRTAVEIPMVGDTWQLHLLDVLTKLANAIEVTTGL
jgi:transcription-repair coupling factor (superfamily II helicase)